MTKLRAPLTVLVLWLSLFLVRGQQPIALGSNGAVVIQFAAEIGFQLNNINGDFAISNNVVVTYVAADPASNAVLIADRISGNTNRADILAEGHVRLLQNNEVWTGSQLRYNFLTRQMDSGPFRTGQQPFFATGSGVHVEETTNGTRVAVATNATVTTEDYEHPLQKISAKQLTLVPGQYVEARNATIYLLGVPVFFVPYYHHDFNQGPNNFNFLPGYRGTFGPYLLSTYNYTLNDEVSGAVHGDWREKRGFAGGPDLNLNLYDWGEVKLKYYYAWDHEPGTNDFTGANLPSQRQRAYASYDAAPFTNFTIKGQGAYLTDPFVTRDFFESQYRANTQPNSYLDLNRLWNNWSLDVLAQPRVNAFYETVERLPEARLTGFSQQIGPTPFYYESETTAGYYRRLYADTNFAGTNFYGTRADTFQQITLPETLFGWLNVTPRVGGRYTYYSEAYGPGATTTNENREVFNTGAEISFKASRLWKDVKSDFFELDGLRHIVEPSLNYVYVPRPNVLPSQAPQFDYELTNSLHMLPLEFPEYNAIDSVDSQNTIRFGLKNWLQTKRDGDIDNLLNWEVFTDWRLRPNTNQSTFSDIFSQLELRPRSWLTLGSFTRYDIENGRFNLAQHSVTFQPNSTWSWTVSHLFLRDTPQFGTGDDLITSTIFYRLNENWGTRLQHNFDARSGRFQEQDYTIYRDLRSWTAAITFRALDSTTSGTEYGVAVTFSLKAFPRFGLGSDTVNSASLLGY